MFSCDVTGRKYVFDNSVFLTSVFVDGNEANDGIIDALSCVTATEGSKTLGELELRAGDTEFIPYVCKMYL